MHSVGYQHSGRDARATRLLSIGQEIGAYLSPQFLYRLGLNCLLVFASDFSIYSFRFRMPQGRPAVGEECVALHLVCLVVVACSHPRRVIGRFGGTSLSQLELVAYRRTRFQPFIRAF